jgi:hypothetical protein
MEDDSLQIKLLYRGINNKVNDRKQSLLKYILPKLALLLDVLVG